MRRRDFVKTGALLAGASSLLRPQMWADVPDHLWEGYQFGSPQVANRLDQGPFGIDQDQGWFTIFATQPSRDHIRNFGGGLVGYTWEEIAGKAESARTYTRSPGMSTMFTASKNRRPSRA